MRAPMIGRTRPSAIIGHTEAVTACTISLLPLGPVTGRARRVVPMTRARFIKSLPTLSSPLMPPCMPMMTSCPSVARASILRSR